MRKFFLFLGILGFFVCLSLGSSRYESLTYDESVHWQEGLAAWQTHQFAVDTNNPPLIRELLVLPFIIKNTWQGGTPAQYVFPSRVAAVCLGAVLLVSVFFVARHLFGVNVALWAMFFLSFEPTAISNSHYVTLDIGASLFLFLSYWAFLQFLEKKTLVSWIGFGFFTGCAFAAKITALLYLIPCFFVAFFITRIRKDMHIPYKLFFGGIFIAFCVVWLTYFGKTDVIVKKRDDKNRVSQKVLMYAEKTNNKAMYSLVKMSMDVPVPLGTYMAAVKNGILRRVHPPTVVFDGKFYTKAAWYFTPLVFLYKTPIPFLFAIFLFFFWYSKDRMYTHTTVLFFIPVVVVPFVFILIGEQPFVRYLLPLYPFLAIAGGFAVVRVMKNNSLVAGSILFLLSGWYVFGTIRQYPYFLSYANEMLGDRSKRYQKLLDSNLDWGQTLPSVASYAKEKKITYLRFSYFGTDNGDLYGLPSSTPYDTYRKDKICAFHDIVLPDGNGDGVIAISVSNWYYCQYYLLPDFSFEKVTDTIGDAVLVFPYRSGI